MQPRELCNEENFVATQASRKSFNVLCLILDIRSVGTVATFPSRRVFVFSILIRIGMGRFEEKELIISASQKSSLLSGACCGCWRSRSGGGWRFVCACVMENERGEDMQLKWAGEVSNILWTGGAVLQHVCIYCTYVEGRDSSSVAKCSDQPTEYAMHPGIDSRYSISGLHACMHMCLCKMCVQVYLYILMSMSMCNIGVYLVNSVQNIPNRAYGGKTGQHDLHLPLKHSLRISH